MNSTMEDAIKGASDIGRMLDSKQLRTNFKKVQNVIMADKK